MNCRERKLSDMSSRISYRDILSLLIQILTVNESARVMAGPQASRSIWRKVGFYSGLSAIAHSRLSCHDDPRTVVFSTTSLT